MSSNPGETREGDTLRADALKWRRRALIIWSLIGICALFYVLGYVLNVLSMPVSIIVWCIVFIFCLRPVVDWLHRRGLGRGLATLLAFALLVVLVGALGLMLFLPGVGASSQFAALAQSLPGYVQGFMDGVRAATEEYASLLQSETVRSWISQAAESFSGFLGNFANAAGTGIVEFGSFIASTAMIIGFALVISFWILMELPGIEREVRRLINPRHRDDFELFSSTMATVIGGYIKATLLQCFIIGLGCGIGYAVLGLPAPAALGIITGLLNIIPVVGPWIGGVVAAIVGFTVSPVAAIAAIVISVAVQQVVYTFVSPVLMADSVDIHPVLTIFGLTCGSAIGGAMAGLTGSILGMLASIPLIAAAKALFVYYYELNTGRRIVSPDGVFFKGEIAGADAGSFDPTMDAAAPVPQRGFKADGRTLHPERHHTDEQKAALRRREKERRRRMERLRRKG